MKKKLTNFLIMTLGCVILSVGVYFFEIPNGFVTGGVAGLGLILAKFTPLSPSVWILILNVTLLILGFLILGKQTGIKTVYCSLLYSALTYALEFIVPLDSTLSDQPIVELVYAVLLVAIGCALIFNCGGSSGGTDIMALILRKYTRLDIGIVVLIADLAVCISSFFLFGLDTGLLSLVGLLARAFAVDSVIESFNACKYFAVITNKREEIASYIMNDIDRGVTVTDAVGEYTKTKKYMLHTVVGRREAIRLRTKIKQIDPDAFIIITTSSEIIGSGFETF